MKSLCWDRRKLPSSEVRSICHQIDLWTRVKRRKSRSIHVNLICDLTFRCCFINKVYCMYSQQSCKIFRNFVFTPRALKLKDRGFEPFRPVLRIRYWANMDPERCTWMNISDNYKSILLCSQTFGVRRPLKALEPCIRIRSGYGSRLVLDLGRQWNVWHKI